MPSIGFTVFKEKILDGTKRQTIRSLRRREIKKGNALFLYWHLRRKDCQLLKITKCVSVEILPYESFCYSDEIARADGFNNSKELREWFEKTHKPRKNDLFMIIRW